MRLWRIVAITAALVAAGCTRPPAPVASSRSPPRAIAPAPSPARPAPPPSPHKQATQPIQLVGMSEADIQQLLGPPSQQADDGPAHTWTYRSSRCAIVLTLYFDISRNGFFALGRQVSGTDGSEKAEQRCLQRIQAGRAR
jgi:hypothetical protein